MLKILDFIFLPISYQQYAISQNFLHGDCDIYITIICYFTLLFICLNLKFVLNLRVSGSVLFLVYTQEGSL